MTAALEVSPTLNLRLPGEWVVLDPADDEGARAVIDDVVRTSIGAADDAALVRRRMRESLLQALTGAQQAGAEMLYLCQEIGGMPMPIAISVHFARELRMAPAFGTSAEAVFAIMKRSFEELEVAGIEDAAELQIDDSRILRTVTIDEQTIASDQGSREQQRISADYWYTIPQTKNILLVNFATPLGDIPHVMLGFFDSIVKASYFEMPEAMEGETAAQPAD